MGLRVLGFRVWGFRILGFRVLGGLESQGFGVLAVLGYELV